MVGGILFPVHQAGSGAIEFSISTARCPNSKWLGWLPSLARAIRCSTRLALLARGH